MELNPNPTTRKIEESIENPDNKKNKIQDNQLDEVKTIEELKKEMLDYAENLDFEKAASIRDKIKSLEKEELGINENI